MQLLVGSEENPHSGQRDRVDDLRGQGGATRRLYGGANRVMARLMVEAPALPVEVGLGCIEEAGAHIYSPVRLDRPAGRVASGATSGHDQSQSLFHPVPVARAVPVTTWA